jgi:hypothetical protein
LIAISGVVTIAGSSKKNWMGPQVGPALAQCMRDLTGMAYNAQDGAIYYSEWGINGDIRKIFNGMNK